MSSTSPSSSILSKAWSTITSAARVMRSSMYLDEGGKKRGKEKEEKNGEEKKGKKGTRHSKMAVST